MVWVCPMQANNDAIEKFFFPMQVDGLPRKRGGLKRTWIEAVRMDL